VVAAIGGQSWDAVSTIDVAVSPVGLGLSLSRTLAIGVATIGGQSWDAVSTIDATVSPVGLGLSLSVTLAIVVAAIGGQSWDAVSTIDVAVSPVGLGLSLTLAIDVVSAVASVGQGGDIGRVESRVAPVSLGVSLSLTLAIKVGWVVDGEGDSSLGSKVVGSSNLLGWGVVRGHSTVGVCHQARGGNNWDSRSSVNQGGVGLSLTLAIAKGKAIAEGRDTSDRVDTGHDVAGQGVLLDLLGMGGNLGVGLLLGIGEVGGDGAGASVVDQTGVLEGDLGNNTNSNSGGGGSVAQAAVEEQLWVSSGAGASGGGKSQGRCDESLHCCFLVMLPS